MNVAVLAGLGAVDLNVKPGEAEVWVDGKFLAEARDLDGYPPGERPDKSRSY